MEHMTKGGAAAVQSETARRRRKPMSIGGRVFGLFNIVFMIVVMIVTAYPIYYVIIASFSDPTALSKFQGMLLLPIRPFTLSAYKMVLHNPMIGQGFINTLFVLIVGVLVNLAMTTCGAYFLSIKGPMLHKGIMLLIVFTMYFSGGLIPGYLNMKDLHLLDSLWALILPGAINTSNLIIMRAAFLSIPYSLTESAMLDGASHFKIMVKIIAPLSKSIFAVMILYYGVAHWNSWFNASIYLRDSNLFPLQLVMRNILDSSNTSSMLGGTDMSEMARITDLIKYALVVITTVPILIMYPFLQKYFVKGVMVGAVKE